MTPNDFRRVGSIAFLIAIAGRVLDLVTTLIGFKLGLVESNRIAVGILSQLGWAGLALEEIGAIAIFLIAWRWVVNPRWSKLSYSDSLVFGISLIAFAFVSLYFFIQNSLWILLTVLGIT
ncbi:MAG: hypothetical protein JRM77_05245 [Nitrososphaerota archaeon]|jgi:hypothetical protein|nr:hypothetical protein [Nitrososphaerota archaeon]